jgi:hypothetical protein
MVSSFGASESTPLLGVSSSSSPVPPSSILHTTHNDDPAAPQQQQHHHVVILMNGGDDELVPPAHCKKDDPLLEDHSSRSRRSRGLASFRDWSQRFRTAVGQHTGTSVLLTEQQQVWDGWIYEWIPSMLLFSQ